MSQREDPIVEEARRGKLFDDIIASLFRVGLGFGLAMPPQAITGTFTASTTCGTNAKVPGCSAILSVRNMPRWPPASAPCAITASTPRASSQRASSTVVADAITFEPQPFTRARSCGAGSPKWKLTTAGRNGCSASAASALKGAHPGPAAMECGSMPSSR